MCVPGETKALGISALGQDCSTGLELCPGFFRKFINTLREPRPSFELLAEDKHVFYCVCGLFFVFFFKPASRLHGVM